MLPGAMPGAAVPRLVLSSLVLLTGVACGEILGVDAYRVAEPEPPDASEDPPLPELPATPDAEFRQACTACAASSCADARRACLESERCRALLRCHGACSDPRCIARCVDTHGESLAFNDYRLCVFGTPKEGADLDGCAVACGGGHNWECVGKYQWDGAASGRIDLDLTITAANAQRWNSPLNFVAGAQVARCDSGVNVVRPRAPEVDCPAWTFTNGYGQVALTALQPFSVLALKSAFWDMQSQIYVRPIARSGALVVPVEPVIGLRVYSGPTLVERLGTPIDHALGIVSAVQTDCLGHLAEVVIDLERAGEVLACPLDPAGNCVSDIDRSARWAFFNVPRRASVEAVGHRPSDGREISRRALFLHDEWDAHVALFPAQLP
jgi:hypothetical protein